VDPCAKVAASSSDSGLKQHPGKCSPWDEEANDSTQEERGFQEGERRKKKERIRAAKAESPCVSSSGRVLLEIL
jgi:hypothetical protein